MVEVRLHGPLAQSFGKKWVLDIKSPAEAVHAIEANKPGLRKLIRELSNKGMVFRVRSKHHDYDNEDVTTLLGQVKRIDIIPIVLGAGPNVRFVIGAVLVVVGVFTTFFGDYSGSVISLGLSMMVGAVTEWLTKVPKKDEATADKKSWTLNGPTNTIDQGYPVQVIYGEVLTGGYPISAGLSASQMTSGGTLDAAVEIVGERDRVVIMRGNRGVYAPPVRNFEMPFIAAPFNLGPPYTYEWAHTVPPLATGYTVTLVDGDKPSCRLVFSSDVGTYAYDGSSERYTADTSGTLTLTMTGLEEDRSTTGTPVVLTRSLTVPISLSLLFRPGGLS